MLKIKIFLSTILSYLALSAESILSISKVLLLSKFNTKLPISGQKKASILGNGPSLRFSLENQADFIKETDIYCVNMFSNSDYYTQIKPQNYVLLDPYFFLYDGEKYNRPEFAQTFNAFREKTTWKMKLYMPFTAKTAPYLQAILHENKFIEPIYFNYVIVRGFAWLRHFFYQKNWGMPQCQNILAASLFIALNQKHEEIYLFGADHSWHEEIRINEDNELMMKQVHFYDKDTNIKHEKVIDVRNNSSSKMYLQFQSLSKAFYAYEVLKEYAEHLGIKIKNASAKSYIDAFERIKVPSIES